MSLDMRVGQHSLALLVTPFFLSLLGQGQDWCILGALMIPMTVHLGISQRGWFVGQELFSGWSIIRPIPIDRFRSASNGCSLDLVSLVFYERGRMCL